MSSNPDGNREGIVVGVNNNSVKVAIIFTDKKTGMESVYYQTYGMSDMGPWTHEKNMPEDFVIGSKVELYPTMYEKDGCAIADFAGGVETTYPKFEYGTIESRNARLNALAKVFYVECQDFRRNPKKKLEKSLREYHNIATEQEINLLEDWNLYDACTGYNAVIRSVFANAIREIRAESNPSARVEDSLPSKLSYNLYDMLKEHDVLEWPSILDKQMSTNDVPAFTKMVDEIKEEQKEDYQDDFDKYMDRRATRFLEQREEEQSVVTNPTNTNNKKSFLGKVVGAVKTGAGVVAEKVGDAVETVSDFVHRR